MIESLVEGAKIIELWPCRYNARCQVRNCNVRATTIALSVHAGGRPIKQYELCQVHAEQVAERERAKGRQIIKPRGGAFMKLCHMAALTALGWYLMAPPNRHTPPSAPLSKWQVKFSFDQARDCEIALGNTLANVKLKLKSEKHYSDLRWYESWQCIASDDPRLKSK